MFCSPKIIVFGDKMKKRKTTFVMMSTTFTRLQFPEREDEKVDTYSLISLFVLISIFLAA